MSGDFTMLIEDIQSRIDEILLACGSGGSLRAHGGAGWQQDPEIVSGIG
jgi:hypothetical protein